MAELCKLARYYCATPSKYPLGVATLVIHRLLARNLLLEHSDIKPSKDAGRYKFTYQYCPKCNTVHPCPQGSRDWLLWSGCCECSGNLQPSYYSPTGNIVVYNNYCCAIQLGLSVEDCELINHYLEGWGAGVCSK